jgi:hypothetical protein
VRITGCITKEVPILLIGSDLDGKVFSEPTNTVLLSLHGAGIVSHHKLSPEQELILRCPDRNSETAVRIVGEMGSSNGIHTYGLALIDPNLNFWSVEFPPLSSAEIEASLLSLMCSSCKSIENVDNNSSEAVLCAANKSVLRFCKHCGFSKLWKPASAVTNPEATSPTAIQMPPATLGAPQSPSAYASPTSAPVQAGLHAPSTSQSSAYHEPRGAVLTMPLPAHEPDASRKERRQHPPHQFDFQVSNKKGGSQQRPLF